MTKNYDINELKPDQDYIIQFDVTSEILSLSGTLNANVKRKSNNTT